MKIYELFSRNKRKELTYNEQQIHKFDRCALHSVSRTCIDSIQTQSLALRALRKRKPQETQALALASSQSWLPLLQPSIPIGWRRLLSVYTCVFPLTMPSTASLNLRPRAALDIIMVACSSDSESEATIIFYGCFFFSRHTFSDVGKPTSPKLSHTTWLSIRQNRCYTDFFKVPPETNGVRKNPKFCTIFHAKSQTISAVVR